MVLSKISREKSGNFQKVCMKCGSADIKVFPGDDNDFYGLNPKYMCNKCGFVGMPLEIALDSSMKRKLAGRRKKAVKKKISKKKKK